MPAKNNYMAEANNTKFTNTMLVDIYALARTGIANDAIAKAIGVNITTFNTWKQKREDVQYALKQAQQAQLGAEGNTLADYVYQKLPDELQKLWDKVKFYEEMENGVERVEQLLEGQSVLIRQKLFIHALASTCFNVSRACSMVNVNRRKIMEWGNTDPTFTELLDEIQFHKKNFFEQAMMDLVVLRHPAAVLHANKTMNKDRGYGETLTVDGEIKHSHTHAVVPIGKLGLSMEALLEIEEKFAALPVEEPKQLKAS